MKTRLSACCGGLILLAVAWGYLPTTMPAAPEPDKRLTLSTRRQDYLLGEPVVLDLSFRNLSKETIRVAEPIIWPNHYEVPVWIGQEGEPFQEFSPNVAWINVERNVVSLGPGNELKYQYRVVGRAVDKDLRLAFPKPGDYRLYVAWSQQSVSNVVQVRIKQPAGEDAQLWQKLNNLWFLALFQVESLDRLGKGHEDVPLKMLDLLYAHPNSGYAPALRHVLSKVAPALRDSLSFEEASRWGEMLGIKGFARAEEDPKDKRLDAIRKDSFEQETTVGNVLRSLSKASGVALDASAEFKTRPIVMDDSLTSVRQCMSALRGPHSSWERRGAGYFLVHSDTSPDERPEGKGKDGK